MNSAATLIPLAVYLVGCQAPLPSYRDGRAIPSNVGRYASVAHCSNAAACQDKICSTLTGAPDQRGVDLAACGTLDVAFTGGELRSVVGTPDVAIHFLSLPSPVSVRVEASASGAEYVLVGFLGAPPAGTSLRCELDLPPGELRALLDVTRCNTLSSVQFLRLTDRQSGSGRVLIDAFEGLSLAQRQ
ncbi:MAG: hypothetical protein H6707_09280 [Deltaproteobacteria bacterium]|nr:hypothetical protein [Deltaproteobacteria bacterium]